MGANNQVQFKIAVPCHENWSEMHTVDALQRHCGACDKVLTDFTGMSDTELVLWFTHSKGKVCGRFSPAQLNRSMTLPTEKPEKKKFWLNALWLIPFAWGGKEAKAQSTTTAISSSKLLVSVISEKQGEAQAAIENKLKTISGTVTNSSDSTAINHCRVMLVDSSQKILAETYTDSAGFYTLELPVNASENMEIRFSWMHYSNASDKITTAQLETQQLLWNKQIEIVPFPQMPVLGIVAYYPPETPDKVSDKKSFRHKMRDVFSGKRKNK